MSNKIVLVALIISLVVIISACTVAQEPAEMEFESGVNDTSYRGVENPKLEPDFKLTEQEKREGVQKITIKCGVQIDMPNGQAADDEQAEETDEDAEPESEGEERVGPKI